MSTRKATNKQNVESTASQDAPALRSKQVDTGSESEPLTPTSRDSNSTPVLGSKRKRRTDSTQSSASTPKRQAEASSSESGSAEARSSTKDNATNEKTETSSTDSPRTRNRRGADKSAMLTRRSGADAPKAPVRTSARGAAKNAAAKTSPTDTSSQKGRGAKKKAETLLSTPVKAESKAESDSEEVPAIKRVKVEKEEVEEEPEEEIVMEIRTQILNERPPSKINIIDSISLIDDFPKKVVEKTVEAECKDVKPEESKDSNESSKDESDLASEIKQETPNEFEATEQSETSSKRPPRRRTASIQDKKVSTSIKVEPKESNTPSPTLRRGSRIRKTASPSGKSTSPVKKDPKLTETESQPPSSQSQVPENSGKSVETLANVEDDDSEMTELIFSTTTDPNNQQLTVDITTPVPDDKEESVPSTNSTRGSVKSASLSPNDLESEGVSEMSVKQFYKEPEFLENNRGIEEDPKLGGIVQTAEKVSSSKDDEESSPSQASAAETTIFEEAEVIDVDQASGNISDSLLEGALLVLDDSTEDEATTKAGNESGGGSVLEISSESDNKSEKLKTFEAEACDGGKDDDEKKRTAVATETEDKSVEDRNEIAENLNKLCENETEAIACDEEAKKDSSDQMEMEKLDAEMEEKLEVEVEGKSEDNLEGKSDKQSEEAIEENSEETSKIKAEVVTVEKSEEKVEEKLENTTENSDGNPNEISKEKTDKKPENKTGKILEEKSEEKSKDDTEEKTDENQTALNEIDCHEDEDDGKKESSECAAMEIDSGVSDVAENNSTDPNEELTLIPEVIHGEQKMEVSDSENTVMPNETTVAAEEEAEENASHLEVAIDATEKEVAIDVKEKKEEKVAIEVKERKKDSIRVVDVGSLQTKSSRKTNSQSLAVVVETVKKAPETPETLKQKENHLKSLGLLTLKAADEAKIEKQKRRQLLQSSSKKINGNSFADKLDDPEPSGSNNHDETDNNLNTCRAVQQYTGTLKTVIKLNRPTGHGGQNGGGEKKKGYMSNGTSSAANASSSGTGRVPLKMTFQKGRGRGTTSVGQAEKNANGVQHSTDEYYTIQNEGETGPQETVTTHGRKSHNRSNNTDQSVVDTAGTDKKETKEIIVIPEKASSFAIHPGRLCQDQCFYCGGKFGLYDTPCHVAQIKSPERQKRILDNEEKLTVDNCLCDACFRHIDRRANQAKKRQETNQGNIKSEAANESSENAVDTMPIPPGHSLSKSVCFVTNCCLPATHTFRRKGFRKTIRKLLGNDIDMSNMGGRLPICDKHYEVIIQCLECALCKRRLIKNHMHHITQDVPQLEALLVKQGIPAKLASNPAVCKLCRYFTNLLLKPPEGKTQKAQFVKNYRRRLLHFHNIQQSDEESEAEELDDQDKPKTPSTQPAKRGRKPKALTIVAVQGGTIDANKSSTASSEDGSNEVVDLDDDSPSIPATITKSGRMQLDNDVMVDYDMPMLCDSPSPPVSDQPPPSKLQAILQGGTSLVNNKSNDDISIALRSNPNISMRELFPGEEEMGLQVNVPFGSSSSTRTPEGWTRVQTFLQYDEPTRRLWEDLQKPYGNQSSFLRHLILLEKFFRNGDLTLNQNASTNAVVYSETVQNRLHSYDSCSSGKDKNREASTVTATSNSSRKHRSSGSFAGASNGTDGSSTATNNNVDNSKASNKGNSFKPATQSKPSISDLSRFSDPIKKLHSNLTITITPKTKMIPETITSASAMTATTSTAATTKNSGSESILKSNLLSRKNSAVEIIPIGASLNEMNGRSMPQQQQQQQQQQQPTQQSSLTKQQKILAAASQLVSDDKSLASSSNIPGSNLPPNKMVSLPPELISIHRGASNSLLLANRIASNVTAKNRAQSMLQYAQQSASNHPRPLKMPPTIIKLPDTLSYHERVASKNWRPTLMPINSGPVRSAPGVLYQTADGRKLPSLVQVQSAGKPYLISIHDYNRMCLLRREKIMREQMMKGGASSSRGVGLHNSR